MQSSNTKKQQWQRLATAFADTTDGLGMKIDPEIFETVVALNALGFTTTQSCAGHLDHSKPYPWVDILAETDEHLEVEFRDAMEAAEQKQAQLRAEHRDSLSSAHLDELFDTAHRLDAERMKKPLQTRAKLVDLLAEFYVGHSVSYTILLHTQSYGDMIRLENHSACQQEISSPIVQKERLAVYQQEMRLFADFLKTKFFLQ